MAGVAMIVISLIIALKHAIFIAFVLRKLQLLAHFAVMIASYGQKLISHIVKYFYDPFKQSALDILSTYKTLTGDSHIRAKFHLYEAQCDMWIDLTIVANFLWIMSEDYNKRLKFDSIKELWKFVDSMGDRKDCGYKKLIHCLEHSLEEISSFHLGHESILELVNGVNSLLESEDYKCNAKMQKIIKYHFDDFVDMINFDELQPLMEAKQLLTNYDISLLNQKTGVAKAHHVLANLLSSKGHCGYIIFLECLDEEKKHRGHQTIANKIRSVLKECNICRPKKYVLQRELSMLYRPRGFLSTVEYFEASERFMYLCQADDGSKLDNEISRFVASHNSAPEAEAVGLLIKTLSFKFRSNVDKFKGMQPKIEKCIARIDKDENRSIIQGNFYLILSCWNRHLGEFEEAKALLKKAKGELFSLACGDDHAKILYNEASLLIEGTSRLGTEEEKQVVTLLRDAMRCFRRKQEGMSVMQVRCQLKKALCLIGSNLHHPRIVRRSSHLKEAASILVVLKKQFNFMPVRLQMQYCIIECDYNRAIGKNSEARDSLQKGLSLQGGRKFERDLTCLEIRQS